MSFDCAVIGAGVSGMAASLILARQGFQVLLLERGARTAPLLRGFDRGGVRFSPGFHYAGGLTPGSILHTFLRYLGIADDLEPVPLDPEGFDRVRILEPAFEFSFPAGWERLREALLRSFPGEAPGIGRYLEGVRAAEEAYPYLNLDAAVGAISVLERMRGTTLGEFLGGSIGDPRLAAVLSAHCFLHGVPPEEAPFTFHAHVVGSYYRGPHALRGGGESLARAFDAALARAGVAVRCGNPVRAVALSAAGAVSGVELADGEVVGCRRIVATLHPALLAGLLPESAFRPAYRRRLAALEDSLHAWIGYAVCEGPLAGLERSNLFVVPAVPAAGFGEEGPLSGRPLYLSAAEAGEGSPGSSGFTVICPVSPTSPLPWARLAVGARTPGYHAVKATATAELRTHLERSCPEIAASVRSFELATPLTLREATGAPAGGLYGVKHRVGQYNPLPQTRVPGLTLAGQAVAAPGVLGATLSAFLACGSLLGHDRLRAELKRCA